jgi:hypothetical protein
MMSRFEITFEGRLVNMGSEKALGSAEVEAVMDLVVDEFDKIGAEDIDVSVDLGNSTLTVSVTEEGADLPEAQIRGNGTIRTAFHAAEIATPGWSINWTRAETLPEADNHPELEFAGAS